MTYRAVITFYFPEGGRWKACDGDERELSLSEFEEWRRHPEDFGCAAFDGRVDVRDMTLRCRAYVL